MTEVSIVELNISDEFCHQVNQNFRWSFTSGTSKECDYLKSPFIKALIMSCCKSIKAKEGTNILNFSPRKKEETSPKVIKGY